MDFGFSQLTVKNHNNQTFLAQALANKDITASNMQVGRVYNDYNITSRDYSSTAPEMDKDVSDINLFNGTMDFHEDLLNDTIYEAGLITPVKNPYNSVYDVSQFGENTENIQMTGAELLAISTILSDPNGISDPDDPSKKLDPINDSKKYWNAVAKMLEQTGACKSVRVIDSKGLELVSADGTLTTTLNDANANLGFDKGDYGFNSALKNLQTDITAYTEYETKLSNINAIVASESALIEEARKSRDAIIAKYDSNSSFTQMLNTKSQGLNEDANKIKGLIDDEILDDTQDINNVVNQAIVNTNDLTDVAAVKTIIKSGADNVPAGSTAQQNIQESLGKSNAIVTKNGSTITTQVVNANGEDYVVTYDTSHPETDPTSRSMTIADLPGDKAYGIPKAWIASASNYRINQGLLTADVSLNTLTQQQIDQDTTLADDIAHTLQYMISKGMDASQIQTTLGSSVVISQGSDGIITAKLVKSDGTGLVVASNGTNRAMNTSDANLLSIDNIKSQINTESYSIKDGSVVCNVTYKAYSQAQINAMSDESLNTILNAIAGRSDANSILKSLFGDSTVASVGNNLVLTINKNGKNYNYTVTNGKANTLKTWQGQSASGYGYIDWNRDGTFGNDTGSNGSYDNFLTVHGDLDSFIVQGMRDTGHNFSDYNVADIKTIVDSKLKGAATGSVTYGNQTVDKISNTQYGIIITSHDMSHASGVSAYNYAIYDTTKNAYIIGWKDTKTGTFTIQGMVENAGRKIASPLEFDLNDDNKVGTTDISKDYDINGDGIVDKTAWAGLGDGVLAFDTDKDGNIGEDGKELFGNNTDVDGDGKADGYKNGFEALKALAIKYLGLDSVSDNKLDATEIKMLEEKAGLTMLVNELNDKGEVIQIKKSLTDLNITELNLGYNESDSVDENGNEHRQEGDGFVMNGKKQKVDDVWFKYC